MEKERERMLQTLTFEILHMERKNLRSKSKTDQKMSEEIQKVIVEYARQL
ncbi:MAG: hypothetical protein HFI37_05235 [Lachnospiraceae bacterium]|nr:hypothetical protein [Lachnospiraceae bacterium]